MNTIYSGQLFSYNHFNLLSMNDGERNEPNAFFVHKCVLFSVFLVVCNPSMNKLWAT
jgi:hypothetical protein